MHNSNDRLKEIMSYFVQNGEEATLEHYNLKQETLQRYLRESKTRNIEAIDINKTLRTIQELYSDDELKAIAKGGRPCETTLIYSEGTL